MYLFIFVDNGLAQPPFYKQHMIYMWSYIKDIMVASFPETNSSHLKMDGWKDDPFLLGG